MKRYLLSTVSHTAMLYWTQYHSPVGEKIRELAMATVARQAMKDLHNK